MMGNTTAVKRLSTLAQLTVVPPVPGVGVEVVEPDLEQAMATNATIMDRVINFFMISSFSDLGLNV